MTDDDRSASIGGSDIPALLGIDRFGRTPYDVYLSKTEPPEPREPNAAMNWGTRLEPLIREDVEREQGVKFPPITALSMTRPWATGHLDGWDGKRVLEIKVTGDRTGWGPDGSATIPLTVNAQVQHYLSITQADEALVAVLIGGTMPQRHVVPRNEKAIALIDEVVDDFWLNHVTKRVPPPWDGSDGASRYLARRYPNNDGTEIIAERDERNIIDELLWTRESIAKMEKHRDTLEQVIKDAMGEADLLLAPEAKISWRKTKPVTRVNWKALAEGYRALITDILNGTNTVDPWLALDALRSLHSVTKPGVRRFVVTPAKVRLHVLEGGIE